MKLPTLALHVLFIASALMATGCGGSAGTNPTAPSAVSSNASPTTGGSTPTTTAGAVITGRVTNSASASSLTSLIGASSAGAARLAATASTPITVTIVGTGNTTTAGPNGEFTLTGVPSGSVQLKFEGGGGSALVTLSGIQPTDRIEISVELRGSTAQVQSENRREGDTNRVEVNGRVSAKGAGTLQVGNTTVIVPGAAVIRHGSSTLTFADINVGDHVEVKGTRATDGVTATEVKVESNDDDKNNNDNNNDTEDDENDDDARAGTNSNRGKDGAKESELKGSVSSLGTGTCPAISFTIKGTTVNTTSATKFDGIACSAIKAGTSLDVKGTLAGTTLAATKVERD